MSCRVSEDTYREIFGFKPEDLNDDDYLSRVSSVLKVSEKSILLVWVSDSYDDYLKLKWSDITKRKSMIDLKKSVETNATINKALLKIGNSIIDIGEAIKQLSRERGTQK